MCYNKYKTYKTPLLQTGLLQMITCIVCGVYSDDRKSVSVLQTGLGLWFRHGGVKGSEIWGKKLNFNHAEQKCWHSGYARLKIQGWRNKGCVIAGFWRDRKLSSGLKGRRKLKERGATAPSNVCVWKKQKKEEMNETSHVSVKYIFTRTSHFIVIIIYFFVLTHQVMFPSLPRSLAHSDTGV